LLLHAKRLVRRRESADSAFEVVAPRLALPAGGALALIGESGSGKSTLLDMLAMVSAPDAAEIFALADGAQVLDIAALWSQGRRGALAAIRARLLGYVPQTGGLLPFLSVGDNIDLPRRLLGLPRGDEVRTLAGRLGIADQLGKKPAALSVGQRQRAAIARALAHGPKLVLADEPTASLDPSAARVAFRLLLEQTRARGAGLIVASHDWRLVDEFGLPRLHPHMARGENGGRAYVRAEFVAAASHAGAAA
jgi:putative ABC transport system ATP-binding protein